MGEKHCSSGPPRRRSSQRVAARFTPSAPGAANRVSQRGGSPTRIAERAPRRRREDMPGGDADHPFVVESPSRDVPSEETSGEAPPTPYPSQIIFRDSHQRESFHALKRRGIVPSRCLSEDDLRAIGILDDVRSMLSQAGLLEFTKEQRYTYQDPTLEFFSSLVVHIGDATGRSQGKIAFRLGNKNHVISESALNKIFGFPMYESYPIMPLSDIQAFWDRISDEPRSRVVRASHLPNPAIRYVHRILSQNVFARVENVGNVTIPELHILLGMLTRQQVNVGYYFMKNLGLTLQKQKRELALGGMVTALATYMGIDLSHLPRVPGNVSIDLGGMRHMGLISRFGPPHCLLWPDQSVRLRLPNPERTNVRDPRNWLLLPPSDQQTPCTEESSYEDHARALEEKARGLEEELKRVRKEQVELARYERKYHGMSSNTPSASRSFNSPSRS